MGLFSNSTSAAAVPVIDKNSPAYAVGRYNLARTNLMLAVILTVVNIVLGAVGANMYLLFSIAFPYFMFDITDILWSIPAIVVLGIFVMYWICSKKKPGFMIAALVTFIFDCLFLVGYSLLLTVISEGEISVAEFILDYATHIWVLVYLIIGTKYAKRYKAAVAENPEIVEGSFAKNADMPKMKMPGAEACDPAAENAPAEETSSENGIQ